MTAPKVGDRVRVVLEGEAAELPGDGSFYLKARNSRLEGGHWVFPPSPSVVSVEILRPSVKVGDVIETADELDALPDDVVVRNSLGCAVQRIRGLWFAANGTSGPIGFVARPATVLYLPDGAA